MTLLFILAGVALTAGIVAVVAFLRGSYAEPEQPNHLPTRSERFARQVVARRLQIGIAVVGAAGAWLVTGILVTPILVLLLVFVLPWLFMVTSSQTDRVERMEALAEWTQRLADVLLLGVGLEQAIVTSRKTAPAALESYIDDLSGRLQARWTPADALRAFADQLDDATSDKVLAALLLRVADRGPGLAGALADLAESVREEVRQRRAIEADRAKHRATVRWMVIIIIVVVVAGSFDTGYVAPYQSLLGVAVLVTVGIALIAVVAWMQAIASHKPTPRFLERDRRSRTGSAPEPLQEPELPSAAPEFDRAKEGKRG